MPMFDDVESISFPGRKTMSFSLLQDEDDVCRVSAVVSHIAVDQFLDSESSCCSLVLIPGLCSINEFLLAVQVTIHKILYLDLQSFSSACNAVGCVLVVS